MEKFEKREAHPLEKYVGRLANRCGEKSEVVGYSCNELADDPLLIVDASQNGGWSTIDPDDEIFKECSWYWYVSTNDLID